MYFLSFLSYFSFLYWNSTRCNCNIMLSTSNCILRQRNIWIWRLNGTKMEGKSKPRGNLKTKKTIPCMHKVFNVERTKLGCRANESFNSKAPKMKHKSKKKILLQSWKLKLTWRLLWWINVQSTLNMQEAKVQFF